MVGGVNMRAFIHAFQGRPWNTKYTNLPAVRWAELNGIQDPFLSDGE